MIGIVLVSHSAKLAEGVAELARGMGGPEVRVKAAGGLAESSETLGTDPILILSAIEAVYAGEGVVVLMDLGSALLSAEMALEMLPPEKRDKVVLCDAPLVEGAVAAAVQAKLGNSLGQVVNEARGALAAKTAHLSTPSAPSPPDQPSAVSREEGQSHELHLVITNRLGLHARPAARFVQIAGRYPAANVQVSNLSTGRGLVSARSINGLATLGIRQGHEILVRAVGADARTVLAALQALADDNFGDKESPESAPAFKASPAQPQPGNVGAAAVLQGLPVSPGIAVGPARLFRLIPPNIPTHTVSDSQAEWEALLAAIEKTRAQIRADRESASRRTDAYTASLFDAHLLFLEDEELRAPAHHAIFEEGLNAAAAWQRAVKRIAEAYRQLEDPYLQSRGVDVEDVGRLVLMNLLGSEGTSLVFDEPGILVATDLTLAETARIDPARVLGICLALGSPTSHSAILIRGLGVPAVAGLGESALKLADGVPLIIDGELGVVYPDPAPALVADFNSRARARQAARASALAASAAPALTADGRRVEIVANIGSVSEARVAVDSGAEGIGVFRTEYLFLDRAAAPDEEEQYVAYRAVAEVLGSRPLIIRTLDAGGDKPIPYLDMGHEANPFLGWRAIRLCLARPDFFKVQLRAILRLAAEFPVKVMFPMIATLAEWRSASALLNEARAEVQARGLSAPDRIETGIMVEIPAAALCAPHFALEVDFFSIGTNDLTQYTLAVERGNPRVAALSDAFHPAVLSLIRQVVEAAHARHKWVGVCGEMAGDPLAIPLLVGLGIDELSMSAPGIPHAKQIVQTLNYTAVQPQIAGLFDLETPEAIRAALALLGRDRNSR